MDTELLVDGRVAAKMAGIGQRSFMRYASIGLAPAGVQLGRLRRWRVREIEEWIAGGCRPVADREGEK